MGVLYTSVRRAAQVSVAQMTGFFSGDFGSEEVWGLGI